MPLSFCLHLFAIIDAAVVRREARTAKIFADLFLVNVNHTFCLGQTGGRERRLFRGRLFLSRAGGGSAASVSSPFCGHLDRSGRRGRRIMKLPTPAAYRGRKTGHGKVMAGKTISISFAPRGLSVVFLALLRGFFLSPLQSSDSSPGRWRHCSLSGGGGGLSRRMPFHRRLPSLGSQWKTRMRGADLFLLWEERGTRALLSVASVSFGLSE